MPVLTRRNFLKSTAATALLPLIGCAAPDQPDVDYGYETMSSLRDVGKRAGVYVGGAVWAKNVLQEKDYAATVAKEYSIIVADYEMKMPPIWKSETEWNFAPSDIIVDFAATHNIKMRGHTLVWHAGLQPWILNALKEGRGRALLETYIHKIMERYRGKILAWDVVNEAIDPMDKLNNDMRKSPWLDALGDDYVSTCFRLAAQADPHTKLVYNDHGSGYFDQKSDAILALLRRMQDKNVPIHAVGTQAHLNADKPLHHANLSHFCKEVKRMGLELHITELDVKDVSLSDDFKIRDAKVAEYTQNYLDTVCAEIKPKQILTWGVTDRRSWLDKFDQNPSGRPLRVLPFDRYCKRKPMWQVLHKTLEQLA
jgi:endo-1,4-beta-xylanase